MNKPDVYKAVAKAMAKVHAIKPDEMKVAVHYNSQIWPWNTKLVQWHLNQPYFLPAHEEVWDALGMDTSLAFEFNFANTLIQLTDPPTPFWFVFFICFCKYYFF